MKQKTTFVYYQTCYTLYAVAIFCSSQYFPCKESGASGVNIKHTLPFEFYTGSQANNYLAKISTKYSFLLLASLYTIIIISTCSQCNKERKKKELFWQFRNLGLVYIHVFSCHCKFCWSWNSDLWDFLYTACMCYPYTQGSVSLTWEIDYDMPLAQCTG